MANVVENPHTQPRPISGRSLRIDAAQNALPPPVTTLRGGQLADALSPVNQNGSFEFDRVIKSGQVLKRTRKRKSWKGTHIVLRPNLLSFYKDSEGTQLRHKISLSELTAIARQKDPKGRAKHVFGIFTSSRNFHLAADSDADAQDWVEHIRREARIDEEEEVMTLASPSGARVQFSGFERHFHDRPRAASHAAGYSSSEAEHATHFSPLQHARTPQAMHSARRPSQTLEYSGPEHNSYSDFSDTIVPAAQLSALSLSSLPEHQSQRDTMEGTNTIYGLSAQPAADVREQKRTNTDDAERVVCHGWIYMLKTHHGMKKWKKLWMVLRAKSLALYKNEEEYSAIRVLPFSSIINAVEIDPISHSKRCCMQLITEDKNYRFCAPDEDNLARWLGSFKSLLVKRKESQARRV